MSLVFASESLKDGWNEFYCLAVDRCYEQDGKEWQGLSYDDYMQKEKDGLLSFRAARVRGEMVGYDLSGVVNEHFLLP